MPARPQCTPDRVVPALDVRAEAAPLFASAWEANRRRLSNSASSGRRRSFLTSSGCGRPSMAVRRAANSRSTVRAASGGRPHAPGRPSSVAGTPHLQAAASLVNSLHPVKQIARPEHGSVSSTLFHSALCRDDACKGGHRSGGRHRPVAGLKSMRAEASGSVPSQGDDASHRRDLRRAHRLPPRASLVRRRSPLPRHGARFFRLLGAFLDGPAATLAGAASGAGRVDGTGNLGLQLGYARSRSFRSLARLPEPWPAASIPSAPASRPGPSARPC